MKFDLADRRVDGGYGLIIVLSSFCLVVITDGIYFSFGNLMVELIEEFNTDRATAAMILSILLGISCLIGPFGGGLCDRYGCRIIAIGGSILSCLGLLISSFATNIYLLYVFYGCFGGAGLGCIYLSVNIIVVQHFSKRRGLACGIALCASGVGTFAFNQFTRVLITKYGWRGTILIEAGMCLQCMVFSLLLLPPFQEEQKTPETVLNDHNSDSRNMGGVLAITNFGDVNTNESLGENILQVEKKLKGSGVKYDRDTNAAIETYDKVRLKQLFQSMFDTKLLTDLRFWIFMLSTVVVHLAFSVVITMTVDRAVNSGMTKYEASWLASSIGIANTLGRGFVGWLADRTFVNRIVMMCVLLVVAGISTALSYLFETFTTRLLGTSLYGFCIGGYILICPLVLADMFTPELIARSFGLYLFTIGLVTVPATPIGGFLFDKTGNYDVTFVVAGSQLVIAGLLALVLRFIHGKPAGN